MNTWQLGAIGFISLPIWPWPAEESRNPNKGKKQTDNHFLLSLGHRRPSSCTASWWTVRRTSRSDLCEASQSVSPCKGSSRSLWLLNSAIWRWIACCLFIKFRNLQEVPWEMDNPECTVDYMHHNGLQGWWMNGN